MANTFLDQLRPLGAFLNVVLHITIFVLCIPHVRWYLHPVWLIGERPRPHTLTFD